MYWSYIIFNMLSSTKFKSFKGEHFILQNLQCWKSSSMPNWYWICFQLQLFPCQLLFALTQTMEMWQSKNYEFLNSGWHSFCSTAICPLHLSHSLAQLLMLWQLQVCSCVFLYFSKRIVSHLFFPFWPKMRCILTMAPWEVDN